MIPADLTRVELMAAWKRCGWLRRHGIGFDHALADPLIGLALRAAATHQRRKAESAARTRPAQSLIYFSTEASCN